MTCHKQATELGAVVPLELEGALARREYSGKEVQDEKVAEIFSQ